MKKERAGRKIRSRRPITGLLDSIAVFNCNARLHEKGFLAEWPTWRGKVSWAWTGSKTQARTALGSNGFLP